jgi:hypothetical protein
MEKELTESYANAGSNHSSHRAKDPESNLKVSSKEVIAQWWKSKEYRPVQDTCA